MGERGQSAAGVVRVVAAVAPVPPRAARRAVRHTAGSHLHVLQSGEDTRAYLWYCSYDSTITYLSKYQSNSRL